MPTLLPRELFWPLVVSIVLSVLPGGKYAIYPFRIFTTWIHECCHAVMALFMGGEVTQITLARDTSGLTQYQLPKGRIRQAFVTSAGYPGASVAGCVLYAASQSLGAGGARITLILLGALLTLSLLLWVRGIFGVMAVALLAGVLFSAAQFAPIARARDLVALLAIQTGLGALLDARELFALSPRSRSDAQQMRSLLWLPPVFWALLWLTFGVGLTFWTVRRFTP